MMIKETTLYLFNDDGIIPGDELALFNDEFKKRTESDPIQLDKLDIDPISPVYKKTHQPER